MWIEQNNHLLKRNEWNELELLSRFFFFHDDGNTLKLIEELCYFYDPDDAFYRQPRIGRDVLWYLLLIYIMKSSVHPTIVPTSR